MRPPHGQVHQADALHRARTQQQLGLPRLLQQHAHQAVHGRIVRPASQRIAARGGMACCHVPNATKKEDTGGVLAARRHGCGGGV
eukprot:265328-Prymnesium_polylepis.1